MKYLITVFLFVISFSSYAQEIQKDSLFIVSYVTGPSWDQAKSPSEQLDFASHSKHLSALRKEGIIIFGARAGEKGLIIFSAKTSEVASKLINNDIAVINGLFETDIQPLNVFYPGCIPK